MDKATPGNVNDFIDHPCGYSIFQMDYFISGKSGKTAYGMFKQACLEMQTRYYNLFGEHCDAEALRREIDKEENDIELLKKKMQLKSRLRNIARVEREFKRFYEQANYLDSKYGFSKMSEGEREDQEYDMWTRELGEKAAIEVLTSGRVATPTALHIKNCPPRIKDELFPKLFNEKGWGYLIDNYTKSNYQLPAELPEVEFKETKLIDFIKEVENGMDVRELDGSSELVGVGVERINGADPKP